MQTVSASPVTEMSKQNYYSTQGPIVVQAGIVPSAPAIAEGVYGAQTTRYQPQTQTGYRPPTGQFRDNICNCCQNCYPSCICGSSLLGQSQCFGFWIASQIASRLGMGSVKCIFSIFLAIMVLTYIIAFFFTVFRIYGVGIIFWMAPVIALWIFTFVLRYKFVEAYSIQENCFVTFLTAFWCNSCSLCQMARHMFGYQEYCDGDALMSADMDYSRRTQV